MSPMTAVNPIASLVPCSNSIVKADLAEVFSAVSAVMVGFESAGVEKDFTA
jgi:hypothetical protein